MTETNLPKRFVSTSFGNIAYLETGAAPKPPVLFVHGIPTSGFLWRHVIRFLQNDFHCLAPDLMGLGDSEVDPKTTQFHMEAQAEMLIEFMSQLGYEQFGLVCHDQGGAAAQIIVARQPERVGCFVITDCVCYDNWPVPAVERMQRLARIPGLNDFLGRTGVLEYLQTRTPLSDMRRGVYEAEKFSADVIAEYLRPARGTPEQRECFRQFLLAGNPRYTQQTVPGLKEFHGPTAVLWAADDYYLSPSWGRKLYEDIPGAQRFELVPFCGHYWQEERPAEFSSLIGEFLAEHWLRATTERTSSDVAPSGAIESGDGSERRLPEAEGAGS